MFICDPTMRCPHLVLVLVLSALAGTMTLAAQDPSEDLSCQVALANLQTLQGRLQAHPQDPALLALAERWYVNLCMTADVDTSGAYGPWLAYAQAIRAQRRTLLAGTRPADFQAVVDDCWVDAVAGDSVAVMTQLQQWPKDSTTPEWQALAAMATHDPGRLTSTDTPDQKYALLCAGLDSGQVNVVLGVGLDAGMDAYSVANAHTVSGDTRYLPHLVEEILGSVAQMLAMPELDDGSAMKAAQLLLAAANVPVDGAATRTAAVAAAVAAARRLDPSNPAWQTAGYAICDACMKPQRTWDPLHPVLLTLGDVAAWNHDRMYQSALRAAGCVDSGMLRTFGLTMLQVAPNLLISRRMAMQWQWDHFNAQDVQSVADAIASTLASCTSLRECSATMAAGFISDFHPEMLTDSLRTLVRQRQAADLGRPNRVLLCCLAKAAQQSGLTAEVGPLVMAAIARDPYDSQLHQLKALFDPAYRMVNWDRFPPTSSWSDRFVDAPSLPWDHVAASTLFAVQWTGSIAMPASGTYVIAVESDDGTRLVVGPGVITNGGMHAATRRTVEIPGGATYPLVLEYDQGGGGASCLLLWKPPGAGDFVIIPASALSHGADHQPGLAAQCVVFASDADESRALMPAASELAFVRSLPYQTKMQSVLGVQLFDDYQFDACIPFLENAAAVTHDTWEEWHLGNALLYAAHPDYQRGAQMLIDGGGLVPAQRPELLAGVTNALLQGHCEQAMLSSFPWDESSPTEIYVRMYLKFGSGDFKGMIADSPIVLNEHGPGVRMFTTSWLQMKLLLAIVSRMVDQTDPDWTQLEAGLRSHQATNEYLDVTAWLSGRETYDQVVARQTAQDGKDAEAYYHGVYDLTIGQHDRARTELTHMIAAHPTWGYVATAAALLHWYASQSAEQLKALPQAKPVREPAAVVPTNPGF